ncbi:MAG: Bcr/CflA family efflux MFS transporter [Gammaproteobacteria bacterium]
MNRAAPPSPSSSAAIGSGILFLLAALLGLQPLSTDLYLPSLPAIGEHFGAPPMAVQSTLSVFIAAFAAGQLVVGPMSDRFGRRPMVLGGLALYLAASLAGALAPSLSWLVAARFFQALGVCCTVLCGRAIVRDLYEPEAGMRVMARAQGWMTVCTLLGPIAGGVLQSLFGWRAAFFALVAIGAVVTLAAVRSLAESNRHLNPLATRPGPLLSTYAGIARSHEFRAFAVPLTGSYGCLFAFISGSSYVLIGVLGVSPAMYGVAFGFVTLGFLVGTLVARRIQPRIGIRGTAMAGGILLAVGGLAMAGLAAAGIQTVAAVVVPVFFTLMAHGMVGPACQVGGIAAFPRSAGAAAALLGFTMHLGAAAIGWWIGASHDGTTLPLAASIGAIGLVTAVLAVAMLRGPARPSSGAA